MSSAKDSGLNLLASVYAAQSGIGTESYMLGNTKEDSRTFSARRLLTGMRSLANVNWTKVHIYWEAQDLGKEDVEFIDSELRTLFPKATVVRGTLETARRWSTALSHFDSDEAVLIHANHDHALLPGKEESLEKISRRLVGPNPEHKLAMVTHFPEQVAQLAKLRPLAGGPLAWGGDLIKTSSAWGTVLANVGFALTWWDEKKFQHSKITRPDNPFGPSVSFTQVDLIIPNTEIMRHLDGYSHVGILDPAAALINQYDEEFSKRDWAQSLWPKRAFAFNVNGPDLIRTSCMQGEKKPFDKFRIGMARLDVAWSLKIYLAGAYRIANSPDPLGPLTSLASIVVSLFQPKSIWGLVSKALDPIILIFLKFPFAPSRQRKLWFDKIHELGTRGFLRLLSLQRRIRKQN